MPSNSRDGNNTRDISNSRNNSSNIKDNSNSGTVSKAACKRRAPATALFLQHQYFCNSGAPATAELLLQSDIRKLATAGTIVQTGRCP
jgi:hypothetical protein